MESGFVCFENAAGVFVLLWIIGAVQLKVRRLFVRQEDLEELGVWFTGLRKESESMFTVKS